MDTRSLINQFMTLEDQGDISEQSASILKQLADGMLTFLKCTFD
jgi:hypothetical protein